MLRELTRQLCQFAGLVPTTLGHVEMAIGHHVVVFSNVVVCFRVSSALVNSAAGFSRDAATLDGSRVVELRAVDVFSRV